MNIFEMIIHHLVDRSILLYKIGKLQAPWAPVTTYLTDNKLAILLGFSQSLINLSHRIDAFIIHLLESSLHLSRFQSSCLVERIQFLHHLLRLHGRENHLTFRIDQIRGRNPRDVIILGNLSFLPFLKLTVLQPAILIIAQIFLHLRLIGIKRNTHYLDLGIVFVIDSLHHRHVSSAVWTPGSPEIEHGPDTRNHLSVFILLSLLI